MTKRRARKVSPAKKRKQPRKRPAPPPADDHKLSQDLSDEFRPSPVHYRIADAYEACFQEGVNPTDNAIAKKLSVRRETVNRWRRLRPDLWAWVCDRVGGFAESLRPMVDRRVTHLAIQGSPDHTKLYYQFVAKVGIAGGDAVPAAGSFILNLLVPCPEVPTLPAGLIPRPAAATIPTVALR